MLIKSDPNFTEVTSTIYQLSQDEKIREQCEAREEYYRRANTSKRHLEETQKERDEAIANNKQLSAEKKQLREELDISSQKLEEAEKEIQRLKKLYGCND